MFSKPLINPSLSPPASLWFLHIPLRHRGEAQLRLPQDWPEQRSGDGASTSGDQFHPPSLINWENPQHWSMAASRIGSAHPRHLLAAGKLSKWQRWCGRGCGDQHNTRQRLALKRVGQNLKCFRGLSDVLKAGPRPPPPFLMRDNPVLPSSPLPEASNYSGRSCGINVPAGKDAGLITKE